MLLKVADRKVNTQAHEHLPQHTANFDTDIDLRRRIIGQAKISLDDLFFDLRWGLDLSFGYGQPSRLR